eukprot:TRINITY_DN15793_c0_g1_i1.p1 TRINITY_DN15793_c0_g1~~TRINITY_DN15793_c0_g1_i1.p1  ORF type:complete len:366 (-),score=64.30 TRINITY_DN15793_c0_g1_i1:68-1165(-)
MKIIHTTLLLFILVTFSLQICSLPSSIQIINNSPVHNNYAVWSNPIQKATNVVLNLLNHNITSSLNLYHLNRIRIQESSVLGGTFYSLHAELDTGHALQNHFIDDTFLKFDWLGLSFDNQTSPQFHPIQLCGPLELYLTAPFNLDMFLPHNVDAGTIRQINIHKGVCVFIDSLNSIELIDPLPIAEIEKLKFVPKYNIRLETIPRLRISADSPVMMSQKRLKVKRVGPTTIDLVDPEEGIVPQGYLNTSDVIIRENLINVMLPQNSKKLLSDGSNKTSFVRRVVQGKAEAVNLYKLSLKVRKEERETDWEALVMERNKLGYQVLSLERRGAKVSAAYDVSLVLNGSLPLHSLSGLVSNPSDIIVN